MENEVLELIEMLYTMVTEAWGVPLGNEKCIVERDKVLNLLDEIKDKLPAELAEARRLVQTRNEFITNAKQEAENIRHQAEERARALGVADAVEFAGSLAFPELVGRYRSADLLVHPSRYEGFGLQIAEAMAAGLPVLCSDGGAAPETAGEAARVVPLAGGAPAFADAILALLPDPAELSRLREAGLRRASLFSWDRAAREIAASYTPSSP